MKRFARVVGPLVLLLAADTAYAQLTMQMGNGWTFQFAGNVNIFGMYQSQSDDGDVASPGALTGVGDKGFFFGTGLLPAFSTFEAKGKEGDTDLAVHFGFAPEVQCGGRKHDCFGAQIDMRQVYLTAGGSWGQILAGKELGLFNRQNILNDQTLFGVGATGIAPGGTTLGRIGFGYIYPNFVGQITYSTPGGKPGQLSIGLFDPSAFGPYTQLKTPRVEAEATYKKDEWLLFANGTLQNGKDPANGSKTAVGGGAGIRYTSGGFSIHGSGYGGKGIGTTLQFNGVGTGSFFDVAVDDDGDLRSSYGFYGQVTYTTGKATLAGSYGSSFLSSTDGELEDFKTENSLVSGGVYYQATKSLKIVWELDYQWSDNTKASVDKNTAWTGAFGLMLFF